jgi:peptidoglycan hydrolase CwlO-like protein
MSKVTEILRNYAQEEKRAHEEYVKDFSASTIAHLVQGGVEREKANFLAKEACLRDEELVKAVNKSVILEKTAEYIEALENDVTKLSVKISTLSPESTEKQAEIPESLKQLQKLGFTKEEIDHLQNAPVSLLEKVATRVSEPWELGRGSGPAVERMDPLLEFILG